MRKPKDVFERVEKKNSLPGRHNQQVTSKNSPPVKSAPTRSLGVSRAETPQHVLRTRVARSTLYVRLNKNFLLRNICYAKRAERNNFV